MGQLGVFGKNRQKGKTTKPGTRCLVLLLVYKRYFGS